MNPYGRRSADYIWLVTAPNTCCGCGEPTFVGIYPDAKEATHAAMMHAMQTPGVKITRYQGKAIEGWGD